MLEPKERKDVQDTLFTKSFHVPDGTLWKKQDRPAGFLLLRSEDLFVVVIPRARNIGRADNAGNVEINAAGMPMSQESNV